MAFLFRPRFRKPAPGPARLDPNNPLTNGIVSCLPFMAGYGPPIDIVPNPQRVNGGNATWGSGDFGNNAYLWNFTNASTADLAFSTTGVFTVAAVFQVTDASGTGNPAILGRLSYTSESVNSGWGLAINPGAYAFEVFGNNASTIYLDSGFATVTLGDHVVVGTDNGVLRSIYIDGQLANNATSSGTLTGNSIPLATTGAYSDGSGSGASRLYLGVVWNRCLSAQEVQYFYDNPWQIFLGGSPGGLFSLPRAAVPVNWDIGIAPDVIGLMRQDRGILAERLASSYSGASPFSADFSPDFGGFYLDGYGSSIEWGAVIPIREDAPVSLEWLVTSRRDITTNSESAAALKADRQTSIEETCNIRLDRAEAAERLIGVRSDTSTLDEWTDATWRDLQTADEWSGNSQRSDYPVATEAIGSGRLDLSLSVQWIIASRVDVRSPAEWLQTSREDLAAITESSRVSRSDSLSSAEWSGNTQRADWTVLSETIEIVHGDIAQLNESVATARLDEQAPSESVGISRRSDYVVPVETIGATPYSLSIADEWSAPIRSDAVAQQEATGPARADTSSSNEWTTSGRADYPVPIEGLVVSRYASISMVEINSSILAINYDIITPIEWLYTSLAGAAIPVQTVGNFQIDIPALLEALAALRSDHAVTQESGVTSRSDFNSPEETTGNIRSDDVVSVEATGSLRGTDTLSPLEVLQTSRRDQTIPLEIAGASLSDVRVALETTGNIRLDELLAAETTGVVRRDQSAPSEIAATASSDSATASETTENIWSDQPEDLEIPGNVLREDLSIPSEYSVTAKSDTTVPLELSAPALSDLSAPSEHISAERLDFLVSREGILVARLDIPTYLESIQTSSMVLANWGSPIEWGISARRDASAAAESLAGASYYSLGPIEWTGSKAIVPFGQAAFTSYAVVTLRSAIAPVEDRTIVVRPRGRTKRVPPE